MDTYKFIADEAEIKWFYEYCIPPLDNDSVYFLSLSARNKKLSEEEREHYHVSRSEMFEKTIIRKDEWKYFIEHLYRLECNKLGHITKNNVPYPEKCLVVYWNLNPASVRKCIAASQRLMFDLQDELVNSSIKNSKPAIDEAFHKMRKAFDSTLSLYARNISQKYWMDFDVDVEHKIKTSYFDCLERARQAMNDKVGRGNMAMVSSAGGWHFLVKKEAIKFNPQEIVKLLYDEFNSSQFETKEVTVNDNLMVALPGTFMYGDYVVFVYNKNDFDESTKLHKLI